MQDADGLALDGLRIRQGDFTLEAGFGLPAGARAAVIGPSGAGKSTLLSAIGGFAELEAGRIRIGGLDVTDMAPGRRPLTTLFQDMNLFPNLTALENVALGIDPGLQMRAEARRSAAAALEQVGLAGMEARRPAQLSGGEQGRVALARALIRARPLLLLDEPFAALGPALKAEMLALLGRVLDRTGATLLMVTHDPADALATTPLTVVVAQGHVHPPAPTAPLLAAPPPALRAYLGG